MNERYYIEKTVDKLSMRIEKHRKTISKSEVQTRRSLIDPMLETLGWDTADPARVLLEYSPAETKKINAVQAGSLFNDEQRVQSMKSVDYALLNSNGEPAAVVEAKKLDGNLDGAAEKQLLDYAQLSGVQYGVITDGNRWKFYSIQYSMVKPPDKRRMFDVSIRHPKRHKCADALMMTLRSRLLLDEELEPPTAMKKMRWL